MTVNLLKRLESSVQSFRITLKKLQQFHISTLSRIENFRKTGRTAPLPTSPRRLRIASPDEDIEFLGSEEVPSDQQTGGKVNIQLGDMDLASWEHDLQSDLAVIETLLGEMEKVSPADDAKLQPLKEQILAKIDAPINPGNRKVLVFTAFADTADYLYEHLAPVLRERHGLHTGRVVGSDRPKSTLTRRSDFQELLMLFSPISKEKALLLPEVKDEIALSSTLTLTLSSTTWPNTSPARRIIARQQKRFCFPHSIQQQMTSSPVSRFASCSPATPLFHATARSTS